MSLERLGIEQIDLWYMHRDDPSIPVADIVGVLRALVTGGKIARFGCSNWTLPRLQEALALGGVNFTANQVLGNVFAALMTPFDTADNVAIDAATFHAGEALGLQLDAYGGTAAGYFEKRAHGKAPSRMYDNPGCAAAAERIDAIARREGVLPEHLALAFLLHLSPHVMALLGPRSAAQLRDSWPAGGIALSGGVMREIAEAASMTAFLAA